MMAFGFGSAHNPGAIVELWFFDAIPRFRISVVTSVHAPAAFCASILMTPGAAAGPPIRGSPALDSALVVRIVLLGSAIVFPAQPVSWFCAVLLPVHVMATVVSGGTFTVAQTSPDPTNAPVLTTGRVEAFNAVPAVSVVVAVIKPAPELTCALTVAPATDSGSPMAHPKNCVALLPVHTTPPRGRPFILTSCGRKNAGTLTTLMVPAVPALAAVAAFVVIVFTPSTPPGDRAKGGRVASTGPYCAAVALPSSGTGGVAVIPGKFVMFAGVSDSRIRKLAIA